MFKQLFCKHTYKTIDIEKINKVCLLLDIKLVQHTRVRCTKCGKNKVFKF